MNPTNGHGRKLMPCRGMATLLFCAVAFALSAPSVSQVVWAPGAEMITDGGFESGATTAWTVTAGTASVTQYGAYVPVLWASTTVAAPAAQGGMNGGSYFLRDSSGGARLKQSINVAANVFSGAQTLDVSATFGGVGSSDNRAKLNVRFLSGGPGSPLIGSPPPPLGDVTAVGRNYETLLVARRARMPIPVGTQTIEVEVQFIYVGGTPTGTVDNVSASVAATSGTPAWGPGQEMIVNGGFEAVWNPASPVSPLTLANAQGWEGSVTNSAVEAYGAPTWPVSTVAAAPPTGVNGGARFLHDSGGGARLIQHVDVSGNTFNGQYSLAVSAAFGGVGASDNKTRVNVRFLSGAAGSPLIGAQPAAVGDIVAVARNRETVLVNRRSEIIVPLGTQTIDIEIEFVFVGGTPSGTIDNVSAVLVPSAAPSAWAVGQEMVVNGEFESGWKTTPPYSPLTLSDGRGWEGSVVDSVVESYGSLNWPLMNVAAAPPLGMGGGSRFLRDAGGGAKLTQWIDVSGNAFTGNESLDVSAAFGGVATSANRSRVNTRFLSGGRGSPQIGAPSPALGNVDGNARNNETVLVVRTAHLGIPMATKTIEIEIEFVYVGGTATGIIDNVSARISAGVVPPTLGVDLIVNHDFESGWYPTSPLVLGNPNGWAGATTSCAVAVYNGPDTPFNPTPGGHLLRDSGGGASTSQTFDVSALSTAINNGTIGIHVAASLGGYLTSSNSAEIRVWATDSNNASTAVGGQSLAQLGPVTPAQRQNATKMLQFSLLPTVVPLYTTRIRIEVHFVYSGGTPTGYADDVTCVLYDTQLGGSIPFPGTSSILPSNCAGAIADDFEMSSGVNGAQPTRGPGYDIKSVYAGDVVTIRLDCASGRFDFSPVVLAANVFQDLNSSGPLFGPPPSLAPPYLHLGSTATAPLLILVDGLTYGGVFGGQVVLPAGAAYSFIAPALPTGTKVRLQAVCIPGAQSMGTPATPCNGLFVATDAQEFRY